MADAIGGRNLRRDCGRIANDRAVASAVEDRRAIIKRVADVHIRCIGEKQNAQTGAGAVRWTGVRVGGNRAEQNEK